MASTSGNSTSSTQIQNSGSEADARNLVDQRKRKRMQSNRESARRSRQRKQKHLDDLMAQVSQLGAENGRLLTGINAATQQFLDIESENSVLRAQVMELTHRLESLDGIVRNMNAAGADCYGGGFDGGVDFPAADGFIMEPWMNLLCFNQPIMASADAFQC